VPALKAASAALDAPALAQLVSRAKAGDADALDGVVRAIQHDVYRLALRMCACPQDAEDATQEVLIKVITKLDSFRGESSVRTWAYRIAVRHVLDRKKSTVEALGLTFDAFGADLVEGLAAVPEPDPMLVLEVKRGCTLAMLTCLDREHRLTFILSDVFDLPHDEAAGLCDVSEDVYRQRLSRARRALEAFTRHYCGLVNETAPCHCSRRVARAEAVGRLHRGALSLATHSSEDVVAAVEQMEGLHDAARLLRQHPHYLTPARVAQHVGFVLHGRRDPLR
jgi:RNA polymerase sigma factor (sigma-70 family)